MSARTRWLVAPLLLASFFGAQSVGAESKLEYENRVRMMVDFAVKLNEYVRQHLADRGLSAYGQAMAEQNARQAERMTPPAKFAQLHPHLVLVLENTERAMHYASQGELGSYRRHQRIIRKEMQILETLAQREQLELQVYGGHY